jgi:hypothetical protein
MTTHEKGVRGQCHARPLLYLWGKTGYPFYRRLCGPQRLSGQVWRISPPPGVDPRTVQPLASRYTDYATRSRIAVAIHIIISSTAEIAPFHKVRVNVIPGKYFYNIYNYCKLPLTIK